MSSVGSTDYDVMVLTGHSNVLLTARPRNKKITHLLEELLIFLTEWWGRGFPSCVLLFGAVLDWRSIKVVVTLSSEYVEIA